MKMLGDGVVKASLGSSTSVTFFPSSIRVPTRPFSLSFPFLPPSLTLLSSCPYDTGMSHVAHLILSRESHFRSPPFISFFLHAFHEAHVIHSWFTHYPLAHSFFHLTVSQSVPFHPLTVTSSSQ